MKIIPDRIKRTRVIVIPYIFLSILAIITFAPFFLMIITSLKVPGSEFNLPPEWIPNPLVFSNYSELFKLTPLYRNLLNSAIISICVTVPTILICSLAAYGLTRLRFKGADILFFTAICTLFVPVEMTFIPNVILMKKLRWLDTFLPVIIIPWFNVFGLFLMRQHFIAMPKEYVEAAKIDGANPWTIYWKCILPMSKAPIGTLTIIAFLYSWNDFFAPLIYISTPKLYPVTLALATWQQSQYGVTRWTIMMAGVLVSIVPVLIVYLFTLKRFVRALSLGFITK